MRERAELIACIRGEIVGPSRPVAEPEIAFFNAKDFADSVSFRKGFLGWKPYPESEIEEVLYYDREMPHSKYGVGLLHPSSTPDNAADQENEPIDIELEEREAIVVPLDGDTEADDETGNTDLTETDGDEFEVTSADIRHPSTIGLTFYVSLEQNGKIIVRLPQYRFFFWQTDDSSPFPLNGRYESATRSTKDDHQAREFPVWRRRPAFLPDTQIVIDFTDLDDRRPFIKDVVMPEDSPLNLQVKVFARHDREKQDFWLVTIVLCNDSRTDTNQSYQEATLYQTYFEVSIDGGCLKPYPESPRPFTRLDPEEQSLALLYRESATWGIGHGCAAGWDAEPGQIPDKIYADVMPAVQIPSMTPEIMDEQGNPLKLSMRLLAELPDNQTGEGWASLITLADEYEKWIVLKRDEVNELPSVLQSIAGNNIDACDKCIVRIKDGITLLRNEPQVRTAFRLANLSMLLQQISAKQLLRRPLHWQNQQRRVMPNGDYQSPWDIYKQNMEEAAVGQWRAFQIAFLLMSLSGVSDGQSADREIVDLIWFPTGGGKTEAYLAVMAFYMFHQRLLMQQDDPVDLKRDGTNVLMRYTLRMLTTQQFQRAASLVCAMEFLRRNSEKHGLGNIPGKRFSLGLWIGRDSSPNKIENAKQEVKRFRGGDVAGNPLVLTECPWCRAEIGRYNGKAPRGIRAQMIDSMRIQGISDNGADGPLLLCPDSSCAFGQENPSTWIPVEVVDERIYRCPPSLIIATADKYAMIAYRPDAGAIFGRNNVGGEIRQTHVPPGLIIQDELHLISGPLGTMYALYEGIFERLCSLQVGDRWIKPKIIASTATIRGAAEQVRALYARDQMQLFPSPGLLMGDSFFGKYARDENNRLRPGRLYLGIHASDYGSILTTQVRTFSSALFRPYAFTPETRDPWWTLLAFYNSLRELGGAKTLFDSDIQSSSLSD